MRYLEPRFRAMSRRGLAILAGLFALVSFLTLAALLGRAAAVDEQKAGNGSSVVQARGASAAAPAPVTAGATAADSAAHGHASPSHAGSATKPAAVRVSRAAARERSMFNRLLAPGRFAYHEIVRQAAARYRVEHRLVMAIIASESGGNPEAISPAGAIGLMQLMPETAERLGVDPWDPVQNVDGAVRYLASQLRTFKSVDLSLVAYNAGPGFAEKYRRGHVELGAETRSFIMRVGRLLQ